MKLTKAAYFAIRAVVHIAGVQQRGRLRKKEQKPPIASHNIARSIKIKQERFLLKVLKPLVQNQILQSIKGPNGGYSLARSASDINLLDIIEAADGPINGGAPYDADAPDTSLIKRLDEVCKQVAEQTRKQLARVKISDLVT